MSIVSYYGTGRRKSSSARVFLRTPTENAPVGIFVNGKKLEQYFVRDSLKLIIFATIGTYRIGFNISCPSNRERWWTCRPSRCDSFGDFQSTLLLGCKKHDAIRSDIPRNLAYKMEKYGTGFFQIFLKMNLNSQKSL